MTVRVTLTLSSARGSVEVTNSPDGGVVLMDGATGLFEGATGVHEKRSGSVYGGTTHGLDVGLREVFLPLLLNASNAESLRAVEGAVRAAASPHSGPVTVTVVTPFTRRSITGTAFVADDAALDGATVDYVEGWRTLGVRVRCPDPFWRGKPVDMRWAPNAAVPFFPLLPVTLSSSEVLGTAQLSRHGGDVPGVGVWSLSGPWTRARLSDDVSGRELVLEPPTPITAHEVVTVHTDTRSGVRVLAPDGSSAWQWVRPPFDVWPVAPDARVRVQMDGTGDGSYARLRLTPRFEAAL